VMQKARRKARRAGFMARSVATLPTDVMPDPIRHPWR
jgi:hypothetical protein